MYVHICSQMFSNWYSTLGDKNEVCGQGLSRDPKIFSGNSSEFSQPPNWQTVCPKKKKKFKHPHVVTVVGLNLKSQSRLCKVTQVRTVIILTSQKEKSTSVINDMDMDIKFGSENSQCCICWCWKFYLGSTGFTIKGCHSEVIHLFLQVPYREWIWIYIWFLNNWREINGNVEEVAPTICR